MSISSKRISSKARECLKSGNNKVSALVALGISAYESGDTREAVKQYLKAVDLSDESAEAHAGLGISYGKLGDLSSAINHLSCALTLNPDCGMLANWLADAYYDNGEFEKAIEYYSLAININAADSNAHNDMADVYRLKGDFAGALELYDRTLAIDPFDTNALLEKAQCLVNLRENKKAIDVLDKLNKEFPSSRDAATGVVIKATILFRLEKYDDACECFRKAIEFFPFNRGILFHAAVCAVKVDQHSEAVAWLERIIEMDPEDCRARRMLERVRAKHAG